MGKIDADNIQLNDVEKYQITILRQELNNEIQQLTVKVANVETSVDT